MNKTTEPTVDGTFLRTMQAHRKGEALSELSAALRDVTEGVRQHAKPGKIILTMEIVPSGNAVTFTTEILTRKPKPDKQPAIFFVDEHFNLVRNDPNQQMLPLRAVPGTETPEAETHQTANPLNHTLAV